MKRAAIYSRPSQPLSSAANAAPQAQPTAAAEVGSKPAPIGLRATLNRHRAGLLIAAFSAALSAIVVLSLNSAPEPAPINMAEIEAQVRQSLSKKPLPSWGAEAFARIAPSVVRVQAYFPASKTTPESMEGVGTGVVIVDTGAILTNLHVVGGLHNLRVTFADGHQSEARVTGVRPEYDLAVIHTESVPEKLVAATMRPSKGLQVGEEVLAVGFPFGIGPSTSSGVISGLHREYPGGDGKRTLANLIQFDAAANPGNSGGPLVNRRGEVIGIVTSIMNPTRQAVFIGIGFAVPIENAASAAGMSPF